LHLGGIGVARGYLHRPELTAEKFLPDPFTDKPGARMYKTGDLCRWLPDGELQILGRMDHQVKIRGVRVELGEIETILRQHPAVREAVVLAQDFGRGRELIAYLLKEPGFSPSEEELKALYKAQVAEWSQVYDHAYTTPEKPVDPTFNLASWDSSYTQKPVPVEEMRVWTESTVARLLECQPKHVLEIGCGLGLLLFRVAPHCEKYVGTDISPVALEQLQRALDKTPLPQVSLHRAAAEQWEAIGDERFDLVVLNSVVLDFPNVDYLEAVLKEAVQRLRPGGSIFVGDVRPLHLAEAFQASVQWFQAGGDWDNEELQRRVRLIQSREEELLLDPAWFERLVERTEGLEGLSLQLKRGRGNNELVRFRYDVLLTTEVPTQKTQPSWTLWSEIGSFDALKALLNSTETEVVALTGLPNRRTESVLRWWQTLLRSKPETPVRTILEKADVNAVEPEELYALAESSGWSVQLRWCDDEPALMEALFARKELGILVEWPGKTRETGLCNNPLQARWWRELPTLLRARVAETLPEVMHPSTLMLLDDFPLTPNGKVNRRAMPTPDSLRLEGRSLEPPVGALEECLVEIWCELLELEDVGRHEDFFALGGHSLLAVQWLSRLREWLGWTPSLRLIFDHPELAALAEALREKASLEGVDLEQQAQALLEVMALSEEEVAAQLQEEV
jgi:ubiquinone/menaquinone biosynthesis C-methylase UbiE